MRPSRSITAPPATITELPSVPAIHSTTPPLSPLPSAASVVSARATEGAKNAAARAVEPPAWAECPPIPDSEKSTPVESKYSSRVWSPGFLKWKKREKKGVPKDQDRVWSAGDASKPRKTGISADVGCAETSHLDNVTSNLPDTTSFSTATDVSYLSVRSVSVQDSGERVNSVNSTAIATLEEPSLRREILPTTENRPASVIPSVNGTPTAPSEYTSSSLQLLLPDVEPQADSSVTAEINSKPNVKNTKSSGNPVYKFLRKAKKRVKVSS